jgi:hypothetical protein
MSRSNAAVSPTRQHRGSSIYMTLATLFVAQATNTDLTISQQITTVPKSKVGERIGRLDEKDVIRLNQAMMVFLGLAVSPRTGRKGE